MNFTKDNLRSLLSRGLIGNRIHFLEEVDSTNNYASELASNGAVEGEIVIADRQTGGRGRLNRIWQSPPERNIYASIVLRPSLMPAMSPQLTIMAGVALAEVLSRYCPGRVSLKWPNDVLIGMKKVCGILTEMSIKDGEVGFVIIGIGVNVNMNREEFDEGLWDSATSLKEETSNSISRVEFAADLCRSFEKWYKILKTEGFDPVKYVWINFSGTVGRYVKVKEKDKIRSGKVLGIDNVGALLLLDDRRQIHRLLSGEVGLAGD
jgi:BirA family biotin operon repressor/biotin-[acetyl-CoA-carboxylase] ligase